MDAELFISSGWNVIEEVEFKERVMNVFEKVSKTLTKSLGPYGKTTIMEKHGNYHITKDGWAVLKNIRFSNPIDNNIMQMIYEIAAQVVVKVGDGSTSAIVASNELLKLLQNDRYLNTVRSKDFKDALAECVTMINSEILNNATQIDKSEGSMLSEVYDLAYISTNGNDEIAKMIQTIYSETKNPSIDYITSKTNKTTYEIIDGYKLPFITYLDRVFVNTDDGSCIVEHPLILMMDFKFEYSDLMKKIFSFSQMISKEKKRKLVIAAPYYDKLSLDIIKRSVMEELRQIGDINIVYTRVGLLNNMSETLYDDFANMSGGRLLTESDFIEDKSDDELITILEEAMGDVNRIVIGKDYATISGFNKRNENMYKLLVNDALNNYLDQLKKDSERNIISTDTFELKKRMSKLNCKMGVIYVGGSTEMAKESNKDLVEDAIKSCESAYTYGYNMGCNMSIIGTVDKICVSEVYDTMDETYKTILNLISLAFKSVYKKIILNKFITIPGAEVTNEDNENATKILNASLVEGVCYDITLDEFSNKIINPCYTDIEILKAATSIISLIVSSNQYISIIIKEANKV